MEGTPIPKGQTGVPEIWQRAQGAPDTPASGLGTAPGVPDCPPHPHLTCGGITKALGDTQKSLPTLGPRCPSGKWVNNLSTISLASS